MKLKTSTILALAAAVACMTSCLSKDGPIYSGTEMCTVVSSSRLVTDGGATFNIVESYATAIPDTLKRIMAQCEVLKQTDEYGTEYDIKLTSFEPVLTRNPVKKSTIAEGALGTDGINLSDCWIDGGYFNTYVNITEVPLSSTRHFINLEWDDLKSNADTVYVSLRHNGFGESFDNEEIDSDKLGISGYYASFPLAGIISSAGKEFVLHIDWEWFKNDSTKYLREKEKKSADISLSK